MDAGRKIAFNIREHPHLDHGYAVTSHSSQEQTADPVLIRSSSRRLPTCRAKDMECSSQPAPIAMDRNHRRLFVAGREPAMMVVMNADDGKVIQSCPISGGADAEVYDDKTGLIFVSTREGWIHIFHEDSPDHYSEASRVKTEFGAKTMAYDP